ncbi:hypothetical protein NIES4071_81670 [Calothrix sp. NIES-4071]|nr:hypothetical protein NIES4071_81670 [Calothrix sp. NIES-4071]BAZ62436.1 hypothetical protein NIES4105_81600 [Calothrix sp. NIES-4105]
MTNSSEFGKVKHSQEAKCENTPQARLEELANMTVELARVVAQNLNAAPELLQKLGNSKDKETRQSVVSNPNTPTNVLLKLGAEFPQELFNNSVLSLLFLENPNLIEEMPAATLVELLKLETVPEDWMVRAANRNIHNDYSVFETLVKSLKTPASVLSKFVQMGYPAARVSDSIALSAEMHVNYAGEMTEGWEEAAKDLMLNYQLDCNDNSVLSLFERLLYLNHPAPLLQSYFNYI